MNDVDYDKNIWVEMLAYLSLKTGLDQFSITRTLIAIYPGFTGTNYEMFLDYEVKGFAGYKEFLDKRAKDIIAHTDRVRPRGRVATVLGGLQSPPPGSPAVDIEAQREQRPRQRCQRDRQLGRQAPHLPCV